MGSTAAGDLSSQAPECGPHLLSSSWSAPLLAPQISTHKAQRQGRSHPKAVPVLASLPHQMPFTPHPPPNFPENLVQISFPQGNSANSSHLTSSHCQHNEASPSLGFSASVSVIRYQTRHLLYVILTE